MQNDGAIRRRKGKSSTMLAHMKAKRRESPDKAHPQAETPSGVAQGPLSAAANNADGEKNDTQVTCDVLCSLGASYPATSRPEDESPDCSVSEMTQSTTEKRKTKACPKQHQLPMFLSKTYHMIDRCDPAIATWSAAGDNFVVKNVEQFASHVLPLYFKHSNFSSFARQLNFYGFRKLRTDPILTSDVDPRTACYVRFYHEKFQKDRPELLHQIKRATKSDQQSKDDVESLKLEVSKLNECIGQMSSNMDRKLAEMSYEYNRRITALSAEYDKLAVLVTQILARQPQDPSQPALQPHHQPAAVATAADTPSHPARVPDLMHSLSQVAAISLQNHLQPPPPGVALGSGPHTLGATTSRAKRPAPDEAGRASPRQRTS